MSTARSLAAVMIAWSAASVVGRAQELRRGSPGGRLFGEVHRMLPRENDSAVGLGDVDDDGDLDAVVGSRLYRNDGAGFLAEAPANLQAGGGDADSLALGDVDGDGDLDVLIGSRALWLNDGTGVFGDASSSLPSSPDRAFEVALGDLDGDGDLDAYLANWSGVGGVDDVYLNDGGGVFSSSPFSLPFNAGGAWTVALGDVDGDGDLDALTGEQGRFMHAVFGVQNRLYLNDGNGFFVDATVWLPFASDVTFAVALGDVDGDDDLDALIGNGANLGDGDRSALWLNDGTGNFGVASNALPPDTDLTQAVALGDVEGDGDLDAFIGNNLQSRLYLNGGAGTFTDAPGNLPVESERTSDVAFGDLDGDGDLDALLARIGGQDRVYLNDGDGTFVDATTRPRLAPGSGLTRDLASGDVDGDGDLDVVSATGARNRLYRNDGTGTFEDAESDFPPVSEDTSAAGLADVDDDGDLDLLTGSRSRPEHLYLNDGAGVFSDQTGQLPGVANVASAVALGDVDGDGDPDALVGARLYVNDGAGTFTVAAGQLPAGFPSAQDVTLGDVDGDGSLDIVLAADEQGLFLNDGNGVFADATGNLPALTAGRARSVALGDVEQDGDLDLLFGLNRFFSVNHVVVGPVGRDHLYLNGGGGVFADGTAFLPDATEVVAAAALADVDGDGDLDAVLGALGRSASSEPNRLYLNDGDGRFTDATALHLDPVSNRTRAVLLLDFDADGDADLWFGNEEEDRLYTNLSRQLAWRSLPRVERPLAMELRGRAFGKWILASALATGATPHPPYGSFQLDPATFQIVGAGALDAGGRATPSFALPPDLDAAGVTLYWQACFLDRSCFSNLEVTTLQDL